ncbi:MAG: hypothetical protein IT340_05970 [Chloroflexi bacterium]|nr:hypothetical protein [Chloroflexota bacterium]
MRAIQITVGDVTTVADLNDTNTAAALWEALPLTATASVWGDEIYFAVPLALGTERGQETVALGDLGYWEPGSALCIFYGRTPASRGDEIRPYSPVTVFGKVRGDATTLRGTRAGAPVRIVALSAAEATS